MSNADYLAAMAEAKAEYERYLEASKRTRPNTRVDSKRTPPALVVPATLPEVSDEDDVAAALELLDAAEESARKATRAKGGRAKATKTRTSRPASGANGTRAGAAARKASGARKAATTAKADGATPKKRASTRKPKASDEPATPRTRKR